MMWRIWLCLLVLLIAPAASRAEDNPEWTLCTDRPNTGTSNDAVIAACNLSGDVTANSRLPRMVLVAIRVTAIDHHLWADAGLLHLLTRLFHRGRIIVHSLPAAAQDDVTVAVTLGDEDCGLAVLGVTEKIVRLSSRQDRLNRNLHIA